MINAEESVSITEEHMAPLQETISLLQKEHDDYTYCELRLIHKERKLLKREQQLLRRVYGRSSVELDSNLSL